MNKCHFIGRLCNDPETQEFPNGGKKTAFRLAVDGKPYTKNGEKVKDTCFIHCEAWSGGGEVIAKWFKKGSQIGITATLRQDNWEDKESGQKRSKLYCRVDEFYFVGDNRASLDDGEEKAPAKKKAKSKKDEFEDEIPF